MHQDSPTEPQHPRAPSEFGRSAQQTPAEARSSPAAQSAPPIAERLRLVGRQFEIPGEFENGAPLGNGHIHDTFLVHYRDGDHTRSYVHQRINRNIFRDADRLMHNIQRVTQHLQKKAAEGTPAQGSVTVQRRALAIVPCRDRRSWHEDSLGQAWRTYHLIEGGVTHQGVERPEQAYHAAEAFARFVDRLRDLPGPRLHDTIPAFHDTPARVRALHEAVREAAAGRLDSAGAELRFALDRADIADRLPRLQRAGILRERVIHNDTKLNNVLFDHRDDSALCVVDLDTVMPGLVHFDFGDLVRTAAITCAEDSPDVEQVDVDLVHFRALAEGYLHGSHAFLTRAERDHLAFAGIALAYETGVRFLTDHLLGDLYFKVHRLHHNLDRARVQFRLVRQLESRRSELEAIVGSDRAFHSLAKRSAHGS